MSVLDKSEKSQYQAFYGEAVKRVILGDLIGTGQSGVNSLTHYHDHAHELAHVSVALTPPNETGLPQYLYAQVNKGRSAAYFDQSALQEENHALLWSTSTVIDDQQSTAMETIFKRQLRLPYTAIIEEFERMEYDYNPDICGEVLKLIDDVNDESKVLDLKDPDKVLDMYLRIFKILALHVFIFETASSFPNVIPKPEERAKFISKFRELQATLDDFIQVQKDTDSPAKTDIIEYATHMDNPKIGFEIWKNMIAGHKFTPLDELIR